MLDFEIVAKSSASDSCAPGVDPVFLTLAATTIACSLLGQIDEYGLLRLDPLGKGVPVGLEIYSQANGGLGVIGTQSAGDIKIGKSTGKKIVRYVFGADATGDGIDEIVVVTEYATEANRPVDLKVYKAPTILNGDLGQPLFSYKKGALAMGGSLPLKAIGAIDLDGDKKDEIAVVRGSGATQERLEIFKMPKGLNKGLGQAISSDWAFATATEDNYALFSLDYDSDGKEEIVALKHQAGGQDGVFVYKPPLVQIAIATLVLSDTTINAQDGATIVSAFPIQRSGPVGFQMGLLRKAPDGTSRIDIQNLPPSVGGDIGAVAATTGALDGVGVDDPVYLAFCRRHFAPLPWADFEGTLAVSLHCAYPDGQGGFAESWIGPFPVLKGDGNTTFGLHVDAISPGLGFTFAVMNGGWGLGNTAGFQAGANTVQFDLTAQNGIAKAGDRVLVTFQSSTVITAGNPKILRYTNPGGPINGIPVGELQIPSQQAPNDLRASIMEYFIQKVP